MPLNVLLIGNGGREHALAWALSRSRDVGTIYCPGGNPGIARLASTEGPAAAASAADFQALAEFAARKDVGLVVVGPEAPLAAGACDALRAHGLPVFGPGVEGARLEFSKAFAKEVMQAAGVATAQAETFTEVGAALESLRRRAASRFPVVVKADGLAAGKGVAICATAEEAAQAVRSMLETRVFGEAGARILLEDFLEGEEVSVLALVDGETIVPLIPAQDHKRVGDGDKGPNTGGMGTYAPAPVATPEVRRAALEQVLRPVARELVRRGISFRGILYAGLMITAAGPRVLEFNTRFGDPETQVILPLLRTDFARLALATARGELAGVGEVEWNPGAAVCVVMASGGYPGRYSTGVPISGLDAADGLPDATIFHAGTALAADGRVVTAGGRVLGVTAWGASFAEARAAAYKLCPQVRFEGAHYRKDIGWRAIGR